MTGTEIVGALFVALGVGLLLGVGWLYALARSAAGWASVQGRVVSSEVEGDWDTDGGHGMNYRLLLTYEYEVGGRTLTGHRLSFGDSFWGWSRSKQGTDRVRKAYEPDQAVTVFYDPAHPTRCTLSRDARDVRFRELLVVAVIILVAGVGVLTGSVRVEN